MLKRFALLLVLLIVVLLLAVSGLSTVAQNDVLDAAVAEDGTVRVLVQIYAPLRTTTDRMTPQTRQATIDLAEQQVLRQLPLGDGVQVTQTYRNLPLVALEVDAEGLRALRQARYIVNIIPSMLLRPALAETIPLIGADTVHAAGYTGFGQTVAILDTGLDFGHPWFWGNHGAITEACFNTSVADGTTLEWIYEGRCPGFSRDEAYGAESSCAYGDCSHGTHVAGIAAGDAGTMRGVAPNADIVAINVFTWIHVAAECDGDPVPCLRAFNEDIFAALDYLIDLRNGGMNIVAANMSLGGGEYEHPCGAESGLALMNDVVAAGIVPVAASHNQGWVDAMAWPACLPNVVSVGNTRDNDVVNSGSNVAYFLDIFAPGTFVVSSVQGGGTDSYTGTSMAAPHVTGAFAVMHQAAPAATNEEILQVFKDTGAPVTDTRPGATVPTTRLQLDAAVEEVRFSETTCAGRQATIYVRDGIIVGGPDHGQPYTGTLRGTDRLDVMIGTEGPDTIYGYATSDYVCGLGGDDVIYTHEGQDDIWGGDGNDTIYAGVSGDDVWGGAGDDYIDLGEGTDTAVGGEGNDTIIGGTGQDYMEGNAGNDRLEGGDGDDRSYGGAGDDLIYGHNGNDRLYGEGGNDTIYGNDGDDHIWGGDGTDDLHGQENNDWLYGEGGDGDQLLGGDGDDRLSGGDGVDDFCNGEGGPHDYGDPSCEIQNTEH